jgi:hypothetical protein
VVWLHIVYFTDTFYTATLEAWTYPCATPWEERRCLDLGDWIVIPDDSTEEDKENVQTYVCLGSTKNSSSENFD